MTVGYDNGRWPDGSRKVRVLSWEGKAPKVGDQLRSLRSRYLILRVWLDGETPKALLVLRVKGDQVEGGAVHPWTWSSKRGRARVSRAETPPRSTPPPETESAP